MYQVNRNFELLSVVVLHKNVLEVSPFKELAGAAVSFSLIGHNK